MDKASYLAQLRAGVANRVPLGVGRGQPQKAKLLDDADPNIGNALQIQAYPAPGAGVATTQVQTNPGRILALDALSPTAQVMTIALSASAVPDPVNDPVFPTMLTGIIQIGNGSVFTNIEIDIPLGRYKLGTAAAPVPQTPEDGTVFVSVPAGTLRVYARHDAKLITTDMIGGVGDVANLNTLVPPVDSLVADAFVKAFVTYGWRPHARPTRTYMIGVAPAAAAITFTSSITQGYGIPPMAKRFRVLRGGGGPMTMPAFSGELFDGSIRRIDAFAVAANVSSPWFDIPGQATFVGINMVLPADNFAALVFEIGV